MALDWGAESSVGPSSPPRLPRPTPSMASSSPGGRSPSSVVVVLGGRGDGAGEQGERLVLGPLAGGEDADEVAVPDAFGDLLGLALGGAAEFLDGHVLQHLSEFEG